MKTLLLIRHAKSDWSNSGLDDFDRPLNQRGQTDLPLLARLLRTHGPTPQNLLASPARRAQQTVEGLAPELGITPVFDERLYLAPYQQLVEVVAEKAPAASDSLALVAHNPGLEELAGFLCGARLHLPTGGIVAIDLATTWRDIEADCGILRYFSVPRLLKAYDRNELPRN
jgi:phosphohistidine phosphatase